MPSSATITASWPRCRRARGWAPPRCAARPSCGRCGRIFKCATCAATSAPACASSTPATTTPSCWPAPDWNGWAWRHASCRDWPPRTGCRHQALGGSCTVPVGAWCVLGEHGLHLRGLVGDAASGRLLHAEASGPVGQAVALGEQVASELLEQGADEFLG